MNSLDWTDGMERWSGLLEWSTGLDYWSATPTVLRISNLGILYGVKGQYVPILTLYQRHSELSHSDYALRTCKSYEVQVGAITISMAQCYKRSVGESISSLDHRWLILSRFVCSLVVSM